MKPNLENKEMLSGKKINSTPEVKEFKPSSFEMSKDKLNKIVSGYDINNPKDRSWSEWFGWSEGSPEGKTMYNLYNNILKLNSNYGEEAINKLLKGNNKELISWMELAAKKKISDKKLTQLLKFSSKMSEKAFESLGNTWMKNTKLLNDLGYDANSWPDEDDVKKRYSLYFNDILIDNLSNYGVKNKKGLLEKGDNGLSDIYLDYKKNQNSKKSKQ